MALEKLERARAEGVDVAFDCYPYTAGSSVLTQLLPQWALEGGIAAMLARLADPAQRRRIAAETVIAQRWPDVFISAVGSPRNEWAVGRNMAEIAEMHGTSPEDATIDLLIEERGDVNFVSFNQSEENLRRTLTHPFSNIISDGFYVRGRPHPRLYGTFPCLLGSVCRARGWMSLEEADSQDHRQARRALQHRPPRPPRPRLLRRYHRLRPRRHRQPGHLREPAARAGRHHARLPQRAKAGVGLSGRNVHAARVDGG